MKSKPTVDPEFIKWKSSGYSLTERYLRKVFTGLIYLAIILISSYSTVKFNQYKRELMKADLAPCPYQHKISRIEAASDVVLFNEVTKMTCYCEDLLK